jgi:hypothetical protein
MMTTELTTATMKARPVGDLSSSALAINSGLIRDRFDLECQSNTPATAAAPLSPA